MTPEFREDVDCALQGFLSLSEEVIDECPIKPGFINSDIVDNFFCQQRGIHHGLSTNPSVSQYGPAVNSIIHGQKTVSRKPSAGYSQAACLNEGTVKKPRIDKSKNFSI